MVATNHNNNLIKPEWQVHTGAYCCRAVFFRDEAEGGYTVFARNLPGVVSEGDSLEEAIERINDAFTESVLSYRHQDQSIPWGDASSLMGNAVPERELHLLVKIDG